MLPIYRRPRADRDLIEHYVYLADHAGVDVADRYLACVEASFAVIAEQPHIGVAIDTQMTALAGTRRWRVNEFEKFLIFYQPRVNQISILRVLHAAQDWWALF
jgi:toxin ParE1/3/4